MNSIKQWLDGLEPRERLTVLGGGVIGALLILYLGVWEPITRAHADLEERVAERRELLAWMSQRAAEVKALRGAGGSGPTLGAQSLLAVVDRTTQSAGLGGSVRRIQPDTGGAVRVWIEDAVFDELIQWLAELHADRGVRVQSLSVSKEDEAGRVTARLLLRAPSESPDASA